MLLKGCPSIGCQMAGSAKFEFCIFSKWMVFDIASVKNFLICFKICHRAPSHICIDMRSIKVSVRIHILEERWMKLNQKICEIPHIRQRVVPEKFLARRLAFDLSNIQLTFSDWTTITWDEIPWIKFGPTHTFGHFSGKFWRHFSSGCADQKLLQRAQTWANFIAHIMT